MVERGEYAFRKIRFSKNSVRKCDYYIFNESIETLLLSDIVRRNITSVIGQWRYMGQSVLNRWENSGNLNRIGSFDNVSVGGKWKAERRAAYPWASSPGQKLASIYRSRVSRRIIISCNWSRENSVLVSRTDALVFAPTLWLCEGGGSYPPPSSRDETRKFRDNRKISKFDFN